MAYEVTDYNEVVVDGYHSSGVERTFEVVDTEEETRHEVSVFVGYFYADKDEFDEEELQEFVEMGYEIEEDVIVMPTIFVIWDGVLDFEESDPDFEALVERVYERYKDLEIPREYFEW